MIWSYIWQVFDLIYVILYYYKVTSRFNGVGLRGIILAPPPPPPPPPKCSDFFLKSEGKRKKEKRENGGREW